MSKRQFLVIACIGLMFGMFGCSSEENSETAPAPNTAAAGNGNNKTNTVNQLSINPDYKK
jgi:hypothetical protein